MGGVLLMEYGYIKFYRNIQNWKWRQDLKMFSVWMTLLTFANYKDENGLKAGQVRISRDALAEEAGVSEQQVRTCIERLIEDGSLTKESSRQGTVASCEGLFYASTNRLAVVVLVYRWAISGASFFRAEVSTRLLVTGFQVTL